VRLSRIEQGTQAGCLGTLIPFPLKDIRRQHSLLPVNIQEETIARSSKRCACGRCAAQTAAERHRHTHPKDRFNKSRGSRDGGSGG
jgi:hypothetical protein